MITVRKTKRSPAPTRAPTHAQEDPVPAVRRPNPRTMLLDLTRRLAEEFETLTIPTVTAAVQSAASATELFGDDVASSIETIERIAREDLVAVSAAAAEQAQTALAS
ncbi:MAG TPA: hypothetical protein VH274_05760 [Mycobacteriales bacterium]|nr:hypothetical protein [Mycobacteriales bacterium]